ncbi:MAG: HAD family hydrolase, partial [Candidatus Marinimicrobia bacterium]|nr:HAD family hydrolase [Candidatus Neomarinimicrobiota bacterium]
MDPKLIKVLAFDADDTLWVNESFYHEAELSLYKLLEDSVEKDRLSMQLFATEMKNIPIYGYGGKSFTLSMIEAAINITNNTVSAEIIGNIIDLGKELVQRPIVLIEGVREVLDKLKAMNSYSLILATKGDLLDQRRKLKESGLINYFDKIDVMDKKSVDEYSKIMKELKIRPEEFMMIGNSMR